jgi:glycyl-tRNA synthetase beta chain
LADKIDTLVGFWGIGERPTGSKDPFALRRAALGAIRLLVENGLRYGLLEAFRVASEAYEVQGLRFDWPAAQRDLLEFFAERLKVALREKGIRHDLIAAVFAVKQESGLGEDDFARLLNRVDALADFLQSDDGVNLLSASKRAGNILRIEEKKDGKPYREPPDPSLLRLPEEIGLAQAMKDAQLRAEVALRDEAFGAAMVALAGLRRPVDDFFERVTVNSNEPAERANRLRLLSSIRATLSTVADFSKIEG